MASTTLATTATGARAPGLAGAGAARRAHATFRRQSALLSFLLSVSLPIILPYFWMVVISFTARSGGVSTRRAVDRLRRRRARRVALQRRAPDGAVDAACAWCGALVLARPRRRCSPRSSATSCTSPTTASCGAPTSIEEIRSKATAGGQFPSVWTAFCNSLALALVADGDHPDVASLAGYYISRFAFRGREAFLQGLLVLHAFPAMTLIIPIFLILHWVGLLDTIVGVVLVLRRDRAAVLRLRA